MPTTGTSAAAATARPSGKDGPGPAPACGRRHPRAGGARVAVAAATGTDVATGASMAADGGRDHTTVPPARGSDAMAWAAAPGALTASIPEAGQEAAHRLRPVSGIELETVVDGVGDEAGNIGSQAAQ